MSLPLIILVRPQMGENIGAVMRAMSNFGLAELRLVAPRDGWPNPQAKKTASGAEDLLKSAKVYPDFTSATADVQLAYATTARPRDMEKRVITPPEAMAEIVHFLLPPPLRGRAGVGGYLKEASLSKTPLPPNPLPQGEGESSRIALVFGPERTGLENDELTWCDTLITIPTAANKSLNLAQSVVIVGYEWWKASGSGLQAPEVTAEARSLKPEALAALSDWQGLFDQLETYLDEVNYYRVADKKTVMWQNLKTMFLRARLSDQEVRTLRGMFRALWERRIRNTPSE